jgi:hypothetical protein
MGGFIRCINKYCCKILRVELDMNKLSLPRTETMMVLFGQEDLVIAEFPQLEKIVLNLRKESLPED